MLFTGATGSWRYPLHVDEHHNFLRSINHGYKTPTLRRMHVFFDSFFLLDRGFVGRHRSSKSERYRCFVQHRNRGGWPCRRQPISTPTALHWDTHRVTFLRSRRLSRSSRPCPSERRAWKRYSSMYSTGWHDVLVFTLLLLRCTWPSYVR